MSALLQGISFASPRVFYLMPAVVAIVVWSAISAERPIKLIAPVIRGIVLALVILALAGPQRIAVHEGQARPALIDLSASITDSMRQWSTQLLRDQIRLRDGDPAIAFGKSALRETVGVALAAAAAPKGCDQCRPGATDLEGALHALLDADDGGGGPVVLVTDGWENQGEAERAIGGLLAAHSRLYIFTPPPPTSIPNVAMTALTLPRALPSVAPFSLGVTLLNMNQQQVGGTIDLYENNRLLDHKPVTLQPGEQRFDFPVRSESAGLISYRAVFKPDDLTLDSYLEDDELQEWLGIGAKRRVLILTGEARDANYLEAVSRRLGLEPAVIDLSKTTFDGSLNGYDAVILNNVPRARLAPVAQTALAAYVEHGGSLAMVGGDQSFGLGGYQGSEVAGAMPVTMKPPEHKQQQRALVLVIDKSGSMGRNNKLTYAKAAALTVTKTMNDDDLVSVIGFDAQPFVVVPLQPLKESRPYLADMIDRLKARGTTFLLPALKEAERDLAGSGAAVKHVVILTDGETGGTATMYYDLIASMHHDGGVTISAIAIGREPNVPLLTSIAQYGGGSFYQTDGAQSLPEIVLQDVKQHGGEITMVEKDFTPRGPAPDAVLKDLAGKKLPPIKGYVGTELKPTANLDLYVDREGRRDPLVASWKFGSGKALAVTTDASGRWSGDWIKANVYTQVWDKLLSWMTPENHNAENFDVALGYRDGKLDLKLIDYGEQPGRAEHLISAAVTRPDKAVSRLMLSEDAPGEMSGSVDAPRSGTYYIELKSQPGGAARVFPPLAFTVSPAVMAEVPRPEPNYGLLERLASATGGRLNPAVGEVDLARPKLEKAESLAPWLLVAAMVLLIGEALTRRLTA